MNRAMTKYLSFNLSRDLIGINGYKKYIGANSMMSHSHTRSLPLVNPIDQTIFSPEGLKL